MQLTIALIAFALTWAFFLTGWFCPRVLKLIGAFFLSMGTAFEDFRDTYRSKWARASKGGSVEI